MKDGQDEQLVEIPIEYLSRGRFQPREHFDEQELTELALSIQTDGLIQPIVVRPIISTHDRFEILAGERRWRAVQALGHSTIRAIVRLDIDDQAAWRVCMAENLHRESLSPIEEAQGYQSAIETFGYTHQRISQELQATKLVHKRSTVSNRLRLLQLPKRIQDLIHAGSLGVQHGLALATNKLRTPEKLTLANKVVQEDWSSRKLIAEIRKLEKTQTARNSRPGDISALERTVSDTIGAKTTISANKITIDFGGNNDVLSGILERMGISLDQH